ncbi:MAG TPA: penicillin-binding protein 2, partial [Thermoanaerobaculia bacterium]|nr:penicillin-binding protein 2 [Thermoanaerobaculia bacterium]
MTLSARRLLYLSALLATWVVIVVCRLFQVQILRHDDYVLRAQRQQERTLTLAPVRGSIRDARGRILAESVTAESVYADPSAIVNPSETARSLAAIKGLGVTQKELERRFRARNEFAWIARQLLPEVAAVVKSLKLAGIYTLEEHRRAYPKSSLAANLLGYVSLDGEGLGGAERSLDRYVRGRAGKVTLLRDARRGMYLVGGEGKNKPVDGTHVILTIDEVVQYLTEQALQKAVEGYGAQAGSAIVMDPRDGSILAMASYPSFDPNRFRDFSPATWRNRGVQDLYEPGSTFKIITASAALEEGIVTPSQIIDCGAGSIEIARTTMREHGGNKYGLMTFEDVLAKS